MIEREIANTPAIVDEILSPPPECEVFIYNDDVTSMDFVVEILTQIFAKPNNKAVQIMRFAHDNGRALVGTYTYDIAATRASIATTRARKQGYPLKIEVIEK